MAELPPPGPAVVEGWLYVLDLDPGESHSVFLNPPPSRRPTLRYRQNRPIDGLDYRCHAHRVRVSCVVGQPWKANGGAFISNASGICLEPEEHILDVLANLDTPTIPWIPRLGL